jgi:hypothetical protein
MNKHDKIVELTRAILNECSDSNVEIVVIALSNSLSVVCAQTSVEVEPVLDGIRAMYDYQMQSTDFEIH